METIVYTGPGSALRIPGEEEDVVLAHGVPTDVPSEVAESLIERDDCDLADEAPEPEITVTDEFEDESEDPEGVNADRPYGEE